MLREIGMVMLLEELVCKLFGHAYVRQGVAPPELFDRYCKRCDYDRLARDPQTHLRCRLFGHKYPPAEWSTGHPRSPHHTCDRCAFFNEKLVPPPPPTPPPHAG